MKKVMRKFVALLMCMIMLMSLVTSVSADTEQSGESQKQSGLSWEKVDDSDITANITSEEADEVTENESTVDPDTEVRVAIVFEEDSAIEAGYSTEDIASNGEALEYMESIAENQEEVLDSIAEEVYDGEALQTDSSFTLTTNAVTATVAYGDIADIEAVDGVSAVYIQTQYELDDDIQTTTAAEMIGSTSTWAAGYTGAGMKVAIIDTGIDIDHQSFSAAGYLYSLSMQEDDSYKETWLTEDQVAATLPYLHATATYYGATGKTLTVDDVYQNIKVPFAYNYIDENLDITHDNDDQSDHGTHVSGIAAANRYILIDGEYVDAADYENAYTVGVASDAQILTMKVFGTAGGAYSEDYVAAIEDAIMLGANSVNISIGSAYAGLVTDYVPWEQEIFDRLSDTDTVVSISAGNSGYWSEESNYGANLTTDTNMATTSSPGTYENALSVASADNTGATGYAFTASGVDVIYAESLTDTYGYAYGNSAFSTLDISEDASGTEYEYIVLGTGLVGIDNDLAALEAALNEEGDSIEGKIVFIQRGTASFYVKANCAVALGAAAVVIYNNTDGTIGLNLSGYNYSAPVVSILESEGLEIIENSEQHAFSYQDFEIVTDSATGSITGINLLYDENDEPILVEADYYTGKMTVKSGLTRVYAEAGKETAAAMSSFSSWGATGALTIKPEITAPGGSIWSTYTDGEYGLMSGTSMAAPSITGMSALVIQHIYDNEALSELVANGEYTARALAQALLMGTAIPLTDEDSGVEYSVRQQGSGLANVANAVTSTAFVTVDGQDDGKVKAELGDDAERSGEYSFTFQVTNFGEETVSYALDSSILTADVTDDGYYYYMSTSDVALGADALFVLDSDSISPVYDLNGDGEVNDLDALLVLQYANDKETLSEEQLQLADLDQDGDVDTRDAYLWIASVEAGDEIVTDTTAILTDADVLSVNAGESASVTVTIRLTEDDMAWLDEYYTNGGYVEGYIYLNAVSADNGEGAIAAVDQSIPFLAYYGSWAEPSMYEPSVLIEDYYAEDGGWLNYNDTYYGYYYGGYTNYFTVSIDGGTYYYLSNLYAEDDAYLPERNALSNTDGDSIRAVVFTQIRNSADTAVIIYDADTGEIYYELDLGPYYGEFYYTNSGYWYYTANAVSIGWTGTDAEGNALPEGTNVCVSVVAVTEYTDSEGNYIIGSGSTLDLPMTIDNTAPEAADISLNEDGELIVTAQDENYIAAVQLCYADGTVFADHAVNQTTAGAQMAVNVGDMTQYIEEQQTSIFNVILVDYAGNESVYRVKLDDNEEYASEATSVSLNKTSLKLLVDTSETLTASVLPYTVSDDSVIWESSDESVATVNQDGVVTAISAGTATITAASVLSPDVKAACEVTVFAIDFDLDGILWDTDGSVHLATVNTADLSGYTETYDIEGMTGGLDYDFMSAAKNGDTLYLATYGDSSVQSSDLYALDTTTGEYTLLLEDEFWMTDMAYSSGTGFIIGTYAYYLVFEDPTSEEVHYGYLDFSSKVGSDYFTGITYLFTTSWGSTNYDQFALITRSGQVYYLSIWVNSSTGNLAYTLNSEGATGITGSWYFSSLYYYRSEDAKTDYLIASAWDGSNTQTLYAIELTSKYSMSMAMHYKPTNVYVLGDFEDGVWPVSGLYAHSESAAETTVIADSAPEISTDSIEGVWVTDANAIEKIADIAD